MKFDSEVVRNEEAVRCIYEYLKTFPIENYVPNRLFQEYRPTDDALYQDLKEYNRDIEWDFLEFFVKRHSSEKKPFKLETKSLWMAFETFLEIAGEKRIAMNGNDCYVFDITKLKKYLNIDTAEFIED